MKNSKASIKQLRIKSEHGTYSINDTCPHCGRYTPNGEVCTACLKDFDLYEEKPHYGEDI